MRWSIDTNPLRVLHPKLQIGKKDKYLTKQLHHYDEDIQR